MVGRFLLYFPCGVKGRFFRGKRLEVSMDATHRAEGWTQMTLVLIGKGLGLEGCFVSKIEDISRFQVCLFLSIGACQIFAHQQLFFHTEILRKFEAQCAARQWKRSTFKWLGPLTSCWSLGSRFADVCCICSIQEGFTQLFWQMTLWAAVATEKTSFFKFMVLSLSRKSFCQDVFQPSFPNQHFFSRHTMTGWNLKITFLAKKHIIFLNLSKPYHVSGSHI